MSARLPVPPTPPRHAALLLGALLACGPSDNDSAQAHQPGEAARVDIDGDGYPVETDCNDDDPAIHPDAA